MRRMTVIAVAFVLHGCATGHPWHGFLDTEREGWRQYLDQRIDVAFSNEPLADILRGPLFPDFNCIINLNAVTPIQATAPLSAEAVEEPPKYLVTLQAAGMTRREALWRIAEQCDLAMSVMRDESGVPRAVLIRPKKASAEATPARYRR